jgi:hypothetical protein
VDDVQALLDGREFRPPAGLVLRRGDFGLGLYVTRRFAAGEILYTSDWFTIPDDDRTLHACVDVDGCLEEMEITRRHSVRSLGARMLDIPGCFMNHSCEPTSCSMDVITEGDDPPTRYHQVALVDLEPGDQITCDYLLFDWDCDGHQFTCACGSERCHGEIHGFSALTREVQEQLSNDITWDVRRQWESLRKAADRPE